MRRTIQIEFNELSPALIDEFIAAGELPNFRRLRDTCEVFVTDASNEINLEPWVQWPTLHTGIPDRDHGIQHLGEADLVAGRGIARELAAAGFSVGVFGSMNLDYGPLDGFVVPDPWNADLTPHPAALSAFTKFVVSAVQENSADRLDKRAALPFVSYLAERHYGGAAEFAFLGLLSLPHNDDGLRFLLRAVWPLVLQRLPGARLRVIGREARPELLALADQLRDSVTVEGYVADLSEALGGVAALVNPLRFGSGIKLKVIEALGRALPVVSTPVGAEGIDSGPGTGVLVGTEPAELAELLCSLTDPTYNADISAQARARFDASYAAAAVFAAYDTAFGDNSGH